MEVLIWCHLDVHVDPKSKVQRQLARAGPAARPRLRISGLVWPSADRATSKLQNGGSERFFVIDVISAKTGGSFLFRSQDFPTAGTPILPTSPAPTNSQ
mmetsp:Transcript_3256/g.7220  ORF Transcript_3256/g.7220 Transcript_3256/m.7220 type:complete len:99 (+) Transcript_3256:3449-3745(+)